MPFFVRFWTHGFWDRVFGTAEVCAVDKLPRTILEGMD